MKVFRRKRARLAYNSPTSYDFAVRENCTMLGGCSVRGKLARLSLIALASVVLGLAVVVRLAHLQLFHADRWVETALKQHVTDLEVASERGPIIDRNGRLLAVSVPASSIYVRPRLIKSEYKESLANTLSNLLHLNRKAVIQKLNGTAPFVWLVRQIPRELGEKVEKLKADGLFSVVESRRYYPYGQVASTLIGKVGIDGQGLSGLEFKLDSRLQADDFNAKIVRDALGNPILPDIKVANDFEIPRGHEVGLTIDANISMIMDQELAEARTVAKAKATMAVMIDADSGEVLGLSQAPYQNFNERTTTAALRNIIAETVYEPGSTLKPIVVASALAKGTSKVSDVVDCENGRFRFANFTINDVHPFADLRIPEIVVRSSNIGMTKIGSKLGAERLYSSLREFGFGSASGLELPGETVGILRDVKNWSKIDVATHSFGQGLAVTPLQMVRATAAIVNGGILPELSIMQDSGMKRSIRVIPERVAHQVRDMMYGVVEDQHGTGTKAAVPGVRIGGKTGTAQKARSDGRGYMPGSYVASFVGFVDGADIGLSRKLVMIVVVDEPHAKSIYGGTLAAPAFKRIIHRTLAYLARADELDSGQFNGYRFETGIRPASINPRELANGNGHRKRKSEQL